MATPERVQNFNEVLSTAMNGVRAVLDQAGLKGWQAFLLIRDPSNPERYTIVSNPPDVSGFDARLAKLHKASALKLRTPEQ